MVAFDEAAEKFMCAQCLYEGDYENPEFVTLKARLIYDAFNSNYKEFKECRQLLEDIEPGAVT